MQPDLTNGKRPGRMTGTEARRRLAELLTQEFRITITPDDVKRLIERRWSLLSPLAHACHDDFEPPATAINAALNTPYGGNP